MRIAVLAYNLRVGGGLSVGRNIIASLRRVADEHEYLIIVPAGVGYEEVQFPARATLHWFNRRNYPDQAMFEAFRMPAAVKAYRPDVVLALGNSGLKRPGAPQAFLYHQPYLLYDKADHPVKNFAVSFELWHVRRRVMASLPATQLVFCQTQTAAARFKRAFGFNGKVAIMPNAVSRFAVPEGEPVRPEVFSKLDGKFVLFCLTRYYPHKGLETLVELFKAESERLKDVAILLTIGHDDGPDAARLVESLKDPRIAPHLINLGRLNQKELLGYFRNARGMILPSLLESFSGTYLEAMQFGCPILTSDRDFAREVCGDAALYFNPRRPASICDAILKLKADPSLAKTLVDAGHRRAEAYIRSWDDIVAEAVRELSLLTTGGTREQGNQGTREEPLAEMR